MKGCRRCAGSGYIAAWCSDLSYCCPGPLPDYAVGVAEFPCDCDLGRSISNRQRIAREAFAARWAARRDQG